MTIAGKLSTRYPLIVQDNWQDFENCADIDIKCCKNKKSQQFKTENSVSVE